MKTIKLSECNKPNQMLLYGETPVGIEYVLIRILNDEALPEIRLCNNQMQVDTAVKKLLAVMSSDIEKGVDKENYSMGKLDSIVVEIDITKENIKQVGNGFEVNIN